MGETDPAVTGFSHFRTGTVWRLSLYSVLYVVSLVTKPGMEEAVMGPYYPRGEYMDKATFEATGPGH